jgi:hypothetical protein
MMVEKHNHAGSSRVHGEKQITRFGKFLPFEFTGRPPVIRGTQIPPKYGVDK